MNDDTLQWIAVQAKLVSEALAKSTLQSLPVETLYPRLQNAVRCRGRKERTVRSPFFPGYLFTRFAPGESLRAVTYICGVTRVVGTRKQPLLNRDSLKLAEPA